MKPLINLFQAFDDLCAGTQFCIVSVFVLWSMFLFIAIPAGVVHFSDKLIIQNQLPRTTHD